MNKIGFGFLRFQKTGNDYDWSAIREMTDLFLDSSGRYFDTCYTYLNGASASRLSVPPAGGRFEILRRDAPALLRGLF